MKITLNDEQLQVTAAIDSMQDKGITVLGEGGTGKTTSIMESVKRAVERNLRVILTAPTNKAVKQLDKAASAAGLSGMVTTMTVHKALGLGLMPSEENKYPVKLGNGHLHNYDLWVLDEGSMVSRIALFDYILPELMSNPTLRLVVMGDDMQLPPVRETQSLALQQFPVQKLEKVERFKDGSGISKLTTDLRQSILSNTRFSFSPEKYDVLSMVPARMDNYIRRLFTKDTELDDVRVLAWTNAQVDYINEMVRENLYGKRIAKYIAGERVVTATPVYCMITDEPLLSVDEECEVVSVQESSVMDEVSGDEYDTYLLKLKPLHADMGVVECHTIHERSELSLREKLSDIAVKAKENRQLWKRFHELKDLIPSIRHCYCITVHRSQGSTYKTTVVDVRNIQRCRDLKMARRLLYVACSRASEKLVLCRDKFTI